MPYTPEEQKAANDRYMERIKSNPKKLARHKASRQASNRKYYQKNKAKHKEKMDEWKAKNPDKVEQYKEKEKQKRKETKRLKAREGT